MRIPLRRSALLLGLLVGALPAAPAVRAQCVQARTINASFVETSTGPYNPGDTYEATLYLSSTAGEDLGVSTMVIDFNDAALSFPAAPVKGTHYVWSNYDGQRTSQTGGLAFYNSEVRFTASDRLTVFVNFAFSTDGKGQALPATPTAAVAIRWTVVAPTEGMALTPRSQQFYNSFAGAQAPLGCYSTGTFSGLETGQQTATGDAGWRMLGAPAAGLTVASLAALNHVQGVPGYYPTAGANLLAGYSGTAFTAPPAAPAEIAPGTGLLWYFYGAADFPAGAPPPSYHALPLQLRHTGRPVAAVTPGGSIGPDSYTVPLHAVGGGWNLVANPFSTPFAVSQLAPVGGALTSVIGQTWEDTPGASGSGTYVLSTDPRLGGAVAGWQGFFVQNSTATGLTFPSAGRTGGAPFLGREAPTPALAFTLAGRTDAGDDVLDRAVRLALDPAAAEGWDALDAGKLTPLGTAWASIAFVGERDGTPVLKAQEARPPIDAGFQVPMAFEAAGADGDYTLTWSLEGLPDDLALLLLDTETGATVDLRAEDHYSFRGEATRSALAGLALPGAPLEAAGAGFTGPRFLLGVGQGVVTAGNPAAHAPEAVTLEPVAPNPVYGAAHVRYAVPTAAAVRVAVYDALGREVAVLDDASRAAGWYDAVLDASALAAGVYVVRLEVGDEVVVRRMTVVR